MNEMAAVLAALPGQTPARLRRLMSIGEPHEVVALVRSRAAAPAGFDPAVWSTWQGEVASLLEAVPARCAAAGVTVVTRADADYPAVLRRDPSAPAVLFVRGDPAVLSARRVAVIGTRRATRAGRHFARTLGARLAAEGVCVVSGLARGIDVESHVGALSVRGAGGVAVGPAAVVASGCDVVYPAEHAEVWERVSSGGVLVSESPPGARPTREAFPRRNRIIAALAEVLVVVESRATGGSMITVREAARRDVTVMVVPGAPGAPASEGTNALLADGCAPVRDAADVLCALGLDTRRAARWFDPRPRPHGREAALLGVFDGAPRTIDELSLRAGLTPVETAVALGRLESAGWVESVDGWWEALLASP